MMPKGQRPGFAIRFADGDWESYRIAGLELHGRHRTRRRPPRRSRSSGGMAPRSIDGAADDTRAIHSCADKCVRMALTWTEHVDAGRSDSSDAMPVVAEGVDRI